MGMSEPILAGVFAWIWLSEKWGAIQLLGGAIVIVGIILADKARTAAH
jgi:drug/metabolite transporter (DMT)-like permease